MSRYLPKAINLILFISILYSPMTNLKQSIFGFKKLLLLVSGLFIFGCHQKIDNSEISTEHEYSYVPPPTNSCSSSYWGPEFLYHPRLLEVATSYALPPNMICSDDDLTEECNFMEDQEVKFPDSELTHCFEEVLKSPLTKRKLCKVIKVKCGGQKVINSLQGLENSPNINQLNFSNRLSSNSDLSTLLQLKKLRNLQLGWNNLEKIELSGLTQLKDLDLQKNKLTELNLATLPQLRSLLLFQNQLKQIDLTGLTELQYLDLQGNPLEAIKGQEEMGLNVQSVLVIMDGFNQIDCKKLSFPPHVTVKNCGIRINWK